MTLLAFSLLISISVAAECRLNQPIPLHGRTLLVHPHATTGTLELRNIVLNKTPESEIIYMSQNTPGVPLAVEFFSVLVGQKPSEHLGVNLNPQSKEDGYQNGGFGIFLWYFFEDFIKGTLSTQGNLTTYKTEDLNLVNENNHPVEPVGISEVDIQEDSIVRVQMTFPVYKIFRSGSYVRAIYQGRNETLCVKSGRLFEDNTPL